MEYPTLYNLLRVFLEQQKLQVPTNLLVEVINMQQGRQSFEALREMLLDLGISSKSYQLTLKELSELETPLFVQVNANSKNELAVLQKIGENNYAIYVPSIGKKEYTQVEFEKIFSGFVLVPFTDEYTEEYVKNVTGEVESKNLQKIIGTSVLIITSLLFLTFSFLYSQADIVYTGCLLILKLTGLGISIQIVKIEMNREDGFIQQVCQKSDCHKVLHSKAAHLLPWLSMGDMGMIYFSSTLLTLFCSLTLNSPEATYSLLSLFSFAALPYTLYSVYYQRFKAKAWCPFCLSVMAIFWLKSISFAVWYISHSFNLDVVSLWNVFIFCTFCSMTWFIIRHLLMKEGLDRAGKQFVNYVKRNTSLFLASLKEGKQLPIPTETEIAPMMGNANSPHTLHLILSPSCPSCVQLYKEAVKFIAKHPDLVKITIYFKSTDEISADNQVIEWILSAYLKNGIEGMNRLYEIWTNLPDKNKKLFEEKAITAQFKLNKQAHSIRLQHHDRLLQADIAEAPLIFYNEKRVPRWYLFNDLITILIRRENEKY